ncbi:cytochrome-c oxidase, cbb3-type subunit III [Marinicauda sp. Alg238-R41]|uniref:cytochrome-c oxidase, cbb3-type subunit III n=1 Tax=Marinicauda sp. Alg238-R41 TaxID=2993447 RepID=UPI0022E485DA|nr:cytochrome-c oxidase, cbb3-type subunit III [Marinicauda sp. Alg238-R41]
MAETDKKDIDAHTGVETTGHEWDGIKELNNPLPRWWLWVFYASIIWSVIYMIFMPAIPALPGMQGYTPGLRDHTERENVHNALAELQTAREPQFARLQEAAAQGGIDAIEADPELLRFALAAGRSAFGDNCATCHGDGGQGAIGYPNLNDDIWLWGGTFDEIRHTLEVGIRSDHPEARYSQMPAYGADGLLERQEINAVADHVMTLAGLIEPTEAGETTGAEIYEFQCAACHGVDATGDRMVGAPNLVDNYWLYGSEREQIVNSIWRGPFGVMPNWGERLNDPTITALAAYVYLLGGGEPDEFAEAALLDRDPGGEAGQ